MPGRQKLRALVSVLDSLSRLPKEIAAEVAPGIEESIREMGKPGGPLRGGNAVKASATASGTQIQIRGVFSARGVRNSWVTAIEKAVRAAIAKKMTEGG